MRIDIPPADSWITTNERFRTALAAKIDKSFADDGVQIQTYAGYTHAIYEITQGLAKLFSHKKTVAFVTPLEPAIEQLAIAFSEEAYVVKLLKPEDISSETLAPLLTDLIFVIYSVDDPVTGRLYDHAKLEAALEGKRVFRLAVSHSRHKQDLLKRPTLFEARVSSLSPEIALVTGGERLRITPAVAPRLPWSRELNVSQLTDELVPLAASEMDMHKKAILDFEADLPAGFNAYFSRGETRLFDRAAIYSEEMDGSAVIELLAEKLGAPSANPGETAPLEATSTCRWVNPKMNEWLLARGERPNVVRGLVLISAALVTSRLKPALSEAAAEIIAMQNG